MTINPKVAVLLVIVFFAALAGAYYRGRKRAESDLYRIFLGPSALPRGGRPADELGAGGDPVESHHDDFSAPPASAASRLDRAASRLRRLARDE